MHLLIFIILSSVGGYLGYKLNIPAGVLIGSMVLVGLWQSIDLVPPLHVNDYVKWGGQCLLGVIMGLMFTPKTVKIKRRIVYFLILFGFFNIVYAFGLAFLVYLITDLSFVNTLIAVTPGGLAEMLILADSLNEDTSSVALFHFLRLFFLLLIIPNLLKGIMKQREGQV